LSVPKIKRVPGGGTLISDVKYTHKWRQKQGGGACGFNGVRWYLAVDSSSKITYCEFEPTMASTTPFTPLIRQASDHSFLVTFGEGISRAHHRDVLRLFRLLNSNPDRSTVNIHPGYSSVLISFDPFVKQPREFLEYVRLLLHQLDTIEVTSSEPTEVPVCYDKTFAPDLEFVATHNGLTPEEFVRLHASVEYLVYFIGFSPGFPYMGDLPARLATPRLTTPRVTVPEGSVAIGGSQTGIYATASPGGWRIIGRTPLRLFNPLRERPATLQMGSAVRFKPISMAEYQTLHNSNA
jgi:inhibitor of KinA